MTIETLWVNAFDSTKTDWTEDGTNPYIDDSDDSIYTNTLNAEEGYFDFANSGVGTGTITSVKLKIENRHSWATGPRLCRLYVWDNSASEWIDKGTFEYSLNMVWDWVEIDISDIITSWTEIDALRVYFKHEASGTGAIRRCKAEIDYSATQTYTKTWQTDALLRKLGITKTAVVDAAFRKSDVTKAFALDSAFLKTTQTQSQVDSLFQKLGIFRTFNIDADLLKHNIEKSFAVDANFIATATYTISRQIDTLLKKHDIPKTFAIDTYIGEVSAQTHTRTVGIDIIFSYKVKLPPILGITLNGQLVIPIKKEMWIQN